MPNVLYVGHYRESSGWGQVTRDQILALDKVGVNVIPRSINLGLATNNIPDRIIELEETGDPKEADIIVQHVLPHYMKYDKRFRKNIGMCELESKNIQHTQWVDHLNIMDELWVPCSDMLDIAGVKRKTLLVPHSSDMEEYKDAKNVRIPNLDHKFVFYFIGTFNRRKHLPALIRAFHTEFDRFEPVELVIKTNRFNTQPDQLSQEIVSMCSMVKQNLRLYQDVNQYKQETVITVDLPRDQLLGLHKACDCLVIPSFGEAWCAPAFDAMAMSNIVIAGNTGGPKDYINHGISGFLVDGTMEPVFGETEAFPGFGTSRELEFDISISDLQKKMRQAYHMTHVEKSEMGTMASRAAAAYSHAVVGERMKELLSV
jgi:glycosyltransferase involved in cell wall biosynthesis